MLLLVLAPSQAYALTCPGDDGAPCDSEADDDLCTDGTFVCTGGVGVCREGPLLYLPLDEGQGAAIVNAGDAPNPADATRGATTSWGPGFPSPSGHSLSFTSGVTSSWVRVPVNEALSTTFTWAFWVNAPTIGSRWVLSRTTSGSIDGFSWSTDGTLYLGGTAISSPPILASTWTHVAITWDGSTVAVYHDGDPVHSAAATATLNWISDVWLGQRQGSHNAGFDPAYAFGGMLDDVVYYGYPLTSGEVASLHALGVPEAQINRELCDGVDNDCRPDTPDPEGTICDGPDSDLCENGTIVCGGNGLLAQCLSESPSDITEVCNFTDDDCDGDVDEGLGTGATCDGADPDSCAGGRTTCDSGGGTVCGAEPVLSYDFETTAGGPNVVTDRSSWHHPGLLIGGAMQGSGGYSGDGLVLDGTAGHVRLYNSPQLRGAAGHLTFSAWIKPTSDDPGTIFYKRGYLHLLRGAGGGIGASADASAPTTFHGSALTGQWTHVAAVMETPNVRLYVNGVPVGTALVGAPITDTKTSALPAVLGCYPTLFECDQRFFAGIMDDVMVFDRVLGPIDLAQVHQSAVWFAGGNEICGFGGSDDDCDGTSNEAHSVGCSVYYRDGDEDTHGAQTVRALRPAVWWPMDALDGSGDLADWAGRNVVIERKWPGRRTSGKVGLALELDGHERYGFHCTGLVSGGAAELYDGLSYAAWVKLRSYDPGPDGTTIINGGAGDIDFGVTTGGNLRFTHDGIERISSATVPLDTWVHVGLTYDESVITFYVGGAAAGTANLTKPISNTRLCLGRRHHPTDFERRFDGLLDEVVVFNRVIGAADMSKVFAAADHDCLCSASAPFLTNQAGDCNDGDGDVHPGKAEVCDGADNDCNGAPDDIVAAACTPSNPESGCQEGLTGCSGSTTTCSARPYAYYNLSEGTGRIAHNRTTEGRGAVLSSGGGWAVGYTGTGYDMSADAMRMVPPPGADSSGAVAFWLRPRFDPTAATTYRLFQAGGFALEYSFGELRARSGSTKVAVKAGEFLQNGDKLTQAWVHLAVTWAPAGGGAETFTLWINGEPLGSATADLGMVGPTFELQAAGIYDDVTVYDQAVPASVLRALRTGGVPFAQQSRELCDALDNDCDGSTDETHDGWIAGSADLGNACDTLDADLCTDGQWRCGPLNLHTRCEDGPIGFYGFEDPHPATAVDTAGSLGSAALTAPRTAGYSGGGFTASSSQGLSVDDPTIASLQYGTLSAWVGPHAGATNSRILALMSGTTGVRLETFTSGTRLRFRVGSHQTTADQPTFGSGWTHVAMTWDAGLDEAHLYVGGARVATLGAIEWSALTGTPDALTAGGPGGSGLAAPYDEVGVWRRALSDTEVQALTLAGPSATQLNGERCDSLDNDCDGTTDEGFSVGAACDAADTDGCTEGRIACTAAGFGNQCVRDGPRGYWPFDDAGDELLDWSGAGLHGVSIGSATAAGRVGQARSLDGVDDRLRLPDFSGLDTTGSAHSIAMWVRPGGDAPGVLFEKSGQYGLRRNADGSLSYTNNADTFCYGCQGSIGFVPTGDWSHVAVTWDGSQVHYYVNGTHFGSHAHSGIMTSTSSLPTLGCRTDGQTCISSWFAGRLDDLVVYDYALSADEVAALITDGVPALQVSAPSCGGDTNCDGTSDDGTGAVDCTTYWTDGDGDGFGRPDWFALQPLAYYSMDTIDGATVTDDSGNGLHAPRAAAPIQRAGKKGKSIRFSRASAFSAVSAPSVGSLSSVAVTAWIRPDDPTPAADQVIVSRDGSFELGLLPSGRLRLVAAIGGVQQQVTTNTAIGTGWWFVHAGWDHTAGSLYVTLVDSGGVTDAAAATLAAQPLDPSSAGIRIGRASGSTPAGFDGLVDEVAIFDRALTTPEVGQITADASHVCACAPPAGQGATVAADCNDDLGDTYPGAPELCDGQDQDCNGLIDDGASADCDDGVPCTVDTCNGSGGCNYAVATNTCQIGGSCYDAGDLDPDAPCQECVPSTSATSWTPRDEGAACNDQDACTSADRCTAGVCGGDPVDCDDDNPCTTDSCESAGGCAHAPNDGATVACYSGGVGTEGVGECKAGTTTCSGSTPGPCSGQVTPQSEQCDAKDNDCNGETDETFAVGDPCDSEDFDQCAQGVIACASLSSARCVDDGPEVWLPLDAVSGTVATNRGWAGKNAFLQSGATTTAGPAGFGSAVVFDGVNDYLQLQPYAELGGTTTTFSLGAWIRRDGGGDQCVLCAPDAAGMPTVRFGIEGGDLTLRLGSETIRSRVPAPADGEWAHVAAVLGGGAVTFYVDGVAYGTHPVSGPVDVPAATGFAVAKPAASGWGYFEGAVDEVQISTRAWPAAYVVAQARPDREACDGTDTNCDGAVDEPFVKAAGACDSGDTDECAGGSGVVCHPLGHATWCDGDGPAAVYRLESLDGRQAPADAGAKAPLLATGVTVVAGKHGQAARITGGGRLQASLDTTASTALDGSWSLWVRLDAGGDQALMTLSAADGADVLWVGRQDGVLEVRTAGGITQYDTAILDVGAWHHLSVSIDGATVTPWFDGRALPAHAASGPLTSAGTPLTFGADWSGSAWVLPMNGAIDEIHHHAGPLDQTAVANLVTLGDACNAADDDCDATSDEGFEDHGQACTATSECVSGTTLTCDSTLTGLECSGGTALAPGTGCDDGDICTHGDQCDGAGGCAGTAYTCDDGLACTDDLCNGDGTCSHPAKPGACAIGGVCYAAGDGDPANPCHVCDPLASTTAWTDRPDGTACSDDTVCTTGDQCDAGTCVGVTVDCEDGDDCTINACDPVAGCVVDAVFESGEPCDDGLICTESTTCQPSGVCGGGAAVDCDDDNPCTFDQCNVAEGCIHIEQAHTESCYDGEEGTANIGTCRFGSRTCSAAVLGPCVGQVLPETELCDDLDNDCDGSADEDFATKGDPCDGPDADTCANGTLTCTSDGSGVECIGDAAADEICDGKDNDCDGLTDEDFPTLGDVCDGYDTDDCAEGVVSCDDSGGVTCALDGPFVSLTGTQATRYLARDVSGSGHDATRYGYPDTPGTGPFRFDGVDDFMEIPAGPNLKLGSKFTIMLHVNRQAAGGSVSLVEAHTGDCPDFAIRINASGAPFAIVEQSHCGYVSMPIGTTLSTGGWHHIALVGTGTHVRLYLDGVVKATKLLSGPVYENGAIQIGALTDGVDAAFEGQLSDIAIYPYAIEESALVGLSASFSAPGGVQIEICDGLDNTCNGETDEHATAETCDGLDNNCDGQTDEGVPTLGLGCDDEDADTCSMGTRTCLADGSGVACTGDGPLAYYRFEAGQGTQVSDYAGTAHGALTGGTWITGGAFGSAVSLDAGGSVTVPSSAALEAPAVAATALLAHVRVAGVTGGTVMARDGAWSLSLTADGAPECTFTGVGAAGADVTVTSATPLSAGSWIGLGCVYDGDGVRLYAGGVLQGLGHAAGAAVASPGTDLVIGAGLAAEVDEVAIWPGAPVETTLGSWANAGLPAANRTREICDAGDNDCDADVDEGYEDVGTRCDEDGDGCENGTWACGADGAMECTGDVPENGIELCNGIDDNCDGQTDEAFPLLGQPCDGDDGDGCANGIWVCNAEGDGLDCDGDVEVLEICNGEDDDCDGVVDDLFQIGVQCDGPDPDQCLGGVWACRADESGRYCHGDGPRADLRLSEGFGTVVKSTTGDGVSGTATAGVSWTSGPNKTAIATSGGGEYVEVTGVGSLSAPLRLYARGTLQSASGQASVISRPGAYSLTVLAGGLRCDVAGASPATCQVNLAGIPNVHHDFACAYDGAGYRLYLDGREVHACAATGSPAIATAPLRIGSPVSTDQPVLLERVIIDDKPFDAADAAGLMTGGDACDGVDNDCDSMTDEDYPSKGQGCDGDDDDECADGVYTCTADYLDVTCTENEDNTEVCDGLDNDCNGLTDELFPTLGQACDSSDPDTCANGEFVCTGDGTGVECAGDLNQPEVCDGLDNDCNGLTDDAVPGLGVACDGDDADTCEDGVLWCDSAGGGAACDEVGASLWLPLTEPAGATEVQDASRYRRTLTPSAVTFTGTEAIFDGSADIVAPAGDTKLAGSGQATIAAWVRPSFSGSPSPLPVVSHMVNGSNLTYSLAVFQNGVRFHLRTDSDPAGGATYDCLPGVDGCTAYLADDTWAHVAVVYDGATVRLYVDGVLQRVLDGPSAAVVTEAAGALTRVGYAPPNRFHGALRDVIVYPSALDRARILHLKENGPSGYQHEYCNLADDTCEGSVDETWSAQLGQSCDGIDGDACTGGTVSCGHFGMGTRCVDTTALVWYPLDETGGVSVSDQGQLGRDGTLRHNVTFTAGKVGGGVELGASSGISRIEADGSYLPGGSVLSGSSNATWMAWIKPTDVTGTRAIVSVFNSAGTTGGTWSLEQSTDGLMLRVRTTNGSTTKVASCNSSSTCGSILTAGVWTHVAVVFSSNGTVRFHVNGENKGTFPVGGNTIGTQKANERLVVGARSDTYPSWSGGLDDLRIYGAAFSTAQVQAEYRKMVEPEALDPCDGLDNDCDGVTDGPFPDKGLDCDGPDSDQCTHGTWTCKADGTALECANETTTDIVEICNGQDDDCDGGVDEDFANAGLACDGADEDSCKEGVWACDEDGGQLICTADGPTGLWRLDTAGATAPDTAQASPNTPLTLTNVTSAPGKFGQAIQLPGTGGNARAVLNIGGRRTLEMWVRPETAGYVYGQATSGGLMHFGGRWAAGALTHFHQDGGTLRTLSASLPQYQWSHVAIVMVPGDLSAGLRMYVNCALVDARPLSQNVASGELTLGRVLGNTEYFGGRIDELAVFDHALPNTTLCVHATTGVPAINENRELCDGSDNDCDGTVDDGLSGSPGATCDGPDSDFCENGTWTCRADKLDVECANETVTGIAETCNALDDDCDGGTDEDFEYNAVGVGEPCDPPGTCGVGTVECTSDGSTAVCSTGPGGSASQVTGEFCDDKDNDCDGATDEKPDGTPVTQNCYTGPEGTLNVGICKFGRRECTDGVFGPCVDDVTPAASDDQCDGKDDDCDGVADQEWGDGIFCTVDDCQGGVQMPVPDNSRCDDGNPCTDDICGGTTDAPYDAQGCRHIIDNTNVPDPAEWGQACRLSFCNGGSVSYGIDDDNVQDDGLSCTADSCLNGTAQHLVLDGTCLIDGACYNAGDVNGSDGCKVCAPKFSKTAWSRFLQAADFDGSAGNVDGYVIEELVGGGIDWDASPERARSGGQSLYFGNGATSSYEQAGARVAARATSPAIQIPSGIHAQLLFYVWMETEGYTGSEKFDTLFVSVIDVADGTATEVWNSLDYFGNSNTDGAFRKVEIDVSQWAGREIRFEYLFDSGDAFFNDYEGVYLDEIRLRTGCCFSQADCPQADAGDPWCEPYYCVDNQCEISKQCTDCVPQQPTVVLALDRSLSMTTPTDSGGTRFNTLKQALLSVTPNYDYRLNMAAKLFPSDTSLNVCNVDPGLDLDFHSSYEALQAYLSSELVFGASPLAAALREARLAYELPAVQAEGGKKFVIAVVDGTETCGEDVLLELAALQAIGVRTIFVAFDQDADKATLTEYAVAGGMARARTVATDPVYVQAGNSFSDLEEALVQAFDMVVTEKERCDGIDDDCDGSVDEGALQLACNLACNEGVGGKQICTSGSYSACTVEPVDEICDGLDNDCDGDQDEDWPQLGLPCSIGQGACFSTGTYECSGTLVGNQIACNAPVKSSAPEVCDNIDNDCDGETDEDLTKTCETACDSGHETCVAGAWVGCDAEPALDEVCDGMDNDCDGLTDNNLPQIPCTGVCGSGTLVCEDGEISGCSTDADPEICDGIDNDCDGETDEDDAGFPITESCDTGGLGPCEPGTRTCVLGVLSGCIADYVATPEVCDGLDNDCDGEQDNTPGGPVSVSCYEGPAGTEGVGECHAGVRVCASGSLGECADQQMPIDEICDGLDNDCDGESDEQPGIICVTEPGCATGACLCQKNQQDVYHCFLD